MGVAQVRNGSSDKWLKWQRLKWDGSNGNGSSENDSSGVNPMNL